VSTDPESDSVRIAKLEQGFATISTRMDGLSVQLNAIGEKLALIGKPNYGTISALAALVISMLGGGFFVISLSIKTELAPIAAKAQVSEVDRGKLNEEFKEVQKQLSESQAEHAKTTEKLREVETQFRAADQIRNIQYASLLRDISMLWKQSFGSDFPSQAYYPSIAQPK